MKKDTKFKNLVHLFSLVAEVENALPGQHVTCSLWVLNNYTKCNLEKSDSKSTCDFRVPNLLTTVAICLLDKKRKKKCLLPVGKAGNKNLISPTSAITTGRSALPLT